VALKLINVIGAPEHSKTRKKCDPKAIRGFDCFVKVVIYLFILSYGMESTGYGLSKTYTQANKQLSKTTLSSSDLLSTPPHYHPVSRHSENMMGVLSSGVSGQSSTKGNELHSASSRSALPGPCALHQPNPSSPLTPRCHYVLPRHFLPASPRVPGLPVSSCLVNSKRPSARHNWYGAWSVSTAFRAGILTPCVWLPAPESRRYVP
jgi:hypothetical protein